MIKKISILIISAIILSACSSTSKPIQAKKIKKRRHVSAKHQIKKVMSIKMRITLV